jgi:hypothetical protein
VVVIATPECRWLTPSPRATPRTTRRRVSDHARTRGPPGARALAASSLTLRPSSCRGCTAGGCHPGTGPAPHRGTGPFPSFEPRSDQLSRSQRIHPLIASCKPPHGCRTRNGRERIGPTTQGKDFSDFVVSDPCPPLYPVLARPVLAVSETAPGGSGPDLRPRSRWPIGSFAAMSAAAWRAVESAVG